MLTRCAEKNRKEKKKRYPPERGKQSQARRDPGLRRPVGGSLPVRPALQRGSPTLKKPCMPFDEKFLLSSRRESHFTRNTEDPETRGD